MEPFSSRPLNLRGEIPEIDVAVAAALRYRDRPAETGRTRRPARRERLVPTGLHRLADRIGARRQTEEHVGPRGVGHRRCTDGATELDAPAREAEPRGCINGHLAIERRCPSER